ncbi:MAG: LCCL domain-containing protein [Rhodanobacteraceae bacterium]
MRHWANRSTRSPLALRILEERVCIAAASVPASGWLARLPAWVDHVQCLGIASTRCTLLCLLAITDLAAAQLPLAQSIDWQTSPLDLDLRGMNGERYTFNCPTGKPQPSRVTGSGPYTDDSSICTAAVHAGLIRPKAGGEVTIEIRPGQQRYEGSVRNYIKTGDYARPWSGSFVIVIPQAVPNP